MKYKHILMAAVAAICLILGCAKEAPRGHFTATMVEQNGEATDSSKVYVADTKYRVDLISPSGPITLIVNKTEGFAFIISDNDKAFTKVGLDNQQLVNKDPFLAVDYLKQRGEVTGGEKESLNGYTCLKETIVYNDKPLLTQWIADELFFPIRIENHMVANRYIELANISRELVSDEIFLVPEGYKEFTSRPESNITIPDWALKLGEVRVMDTPFERNLGAGDMIRIPVRSETSIWIKAEPFPDRATEVRAIPFGNGHPLQEIDLYPNIADDNIVCARRSETLREAAEIVVRVFAGAAKITVKGVTTTQKFLKDGKVGILAVKPNLMLEEFRLVNSTGEPAVVSWDFYEDDIPLIAGEHQVPISGRVTLEPYEVKIATIPVPGNRLHIRSEKGDVLVCLGQWDPSKF